MPGLTPFLSMPIVSVMETAIRQNGTRIRLARGGRGFNGTAFAKRLGISRQHLANIEYDRAAPSLELLVRIADELGTSTDYLLGRDAKAA